MIFKIILCNRQKPAARCSRPLCSSQHTVGTVSLSAPRFSHTVQRKSEDAKRRRLVPQDPTACRCDTRNPPRSHRKRCTKRELLPSHHVKCSTLELTTGRRVRPKWLCAGSAGEMLLRKEVIQPHLPVRLPCYDLVPITSLTLDGSPH